MSKIKRFVAGYKDAVTDFTANAQYAIVAHSLQNVGLGVLTIVFGLYVVARTGSDLTLGGAEAASSVALAIICFLAAPLVTMTGYKRTLIFSAGCYALARFGQTAIPFALPIIAFGFINGMGEGINQASVVPFLSENSRERHRDYLFSVDLFARVGSQFIGCIIGGLVPALLRIWIDQAIAYQITVGIAAAFYASSLIPLNKITETSLARKPKHAFKRYYATLRGFTERKHLASLVIPYFTISLGAGITMPFLSRYLQSSLDASDAAIGIIIGVTQLFVALTSLSGPFLKRTLGVRWAMVCIQFASLPFLIAVPWAPSVVIVAPILWIRTALMNMSWPLFNQYSMQNIKPRDKPLIGAAIALSWAVGQIIGDLIGGQLMHAGLGDYSYYITAGVYLIGIFFVATMIDDKRGVETEKPAVEYVGEGEMIAASARVDEFLPEDDRY